VFIKQGPVLTGGLSIQVMHLISLQRVLKLRQNIYMGTLFPIFSSVYRVS